MKIVRRRNPPTKNDTVNRIGEGRLENIKQISNNIFRFSFQVLKWKVCILLLMSAACNKIVTSESDNNAVADNHSDLRGNIEELGNLNVTWGEDEKVLYVLSNGESFQYTIENSTVGKFVGIFHPGDISTENENGIIVRPVEMDCRNPFDSRVYLPEYYQYGQSIPVYGCGKREKNEFRLKHLCGYVMFEIGNVPAGSDTFIFKVTNSRKINGTYCVDITSNNPVISTSTSLDKASQCITVFLDSNDTDSYRTIILPLPIGTYKYEWEVLRGGVCVGWQEGSNLLQVVRAQLYTVKAQCAELHQ